MKSKSNKEKVLGYMSGGRTMTASYAEFRGIGNVGEVVRQLRSEGHMIYTNSDGYRIGRPSKKLVAAMYSIFGAAAFSGNKQNQSV